MWQQGNSTPSNYREKVTEYTAFNQQVHSSPILSTPSPFSALPDHQVPSTMPPAPIVPHLPKEVTTIPSSSVFPNIYPLDSDNESIFDAMVDSNKYLIQSISSYIRYALVLELYHLPPKVANKRRKRLNQSQLYSIRRTQSDTSGSARFLSTSLHSMSQVIIPFHTDKISIYNRYEESS